MQKLAPDPAVQSHPLRNVSDVGAGGEIQLTDAMAKMIGHIPFHGLRFEGRRFDCGDKIGFFEANLAFALERDELRDDIAGVLKQYVDR